jgi:hypothetical protein
VERPVGSFAEMEQQVELGISSLQRAGIVALEGVRPRCGMGVRGWRSLRDERRDGRESGDKQRCDAAHEP